MFDGQSVRSAAEELEINESLIHKWKRAAKTNGDAAVSGKESAEIETLRKRNRELDKGDKIEDINQVRLGNLRFYRRLLQSGRMTFEFGFQKPDRIRMELQAKSGGIKREFFV